MGRDNLTEILCFCAHKLYKAKQDRCSVFAQIKLLFLIICDDVFNLI